MLAELVARARRRGRSRRRAARRSDGRAPHGGGEAELAERLAARGRRRARAAPGRVARELEPAAEDLVGSLALAAPRRGERRVDASARSPRGAGRGRRGGAPRAGGAPPARRGSARRGGRARRRPGQSIIASRSAMATAWVRVSASSFARMWRTWLFTVSWLMKSFVGDVHVRHAVGEQLQDLALARRQDVGAAPCPATNSAMSPGSTNVSPGGDLLDRAEQRLVRGLLEDVAASRRTRARAGGASCSP